jgi:GNAT superfamily N-acetyltransferase
VSVRIVPLETRHRVDWERLFRGYLDFYETAMPEDEIVVLWARLLDPSSGMAGLVAEATDGRVLGIANYVVYPNSFGSAPDCYLEDLFVDPAARGQGIGRALIEALSALRREQGWRKVWWKTRAGNFQAQGLYDAVATRTAWVLYEITG